MYKKIIKKFILLICVILLHDIIYAAGIKSVICPYCGERGQINIINDADGLCQCNSCDDMFLILNGKIILKNGKKFNLKEFYDLDSLYEEEESNSENANKSNFRAEVDEAKIDNNSDEDEQLEGYSENKYLYYEPEEDEIESPNVDLRKIASSSELLYKAFYKYDENAILHTIFYKDSNTDKTYDIDIVENGKEFKTVASPNRSGYKFVGWSFNKNNKIVIGELSPLILVNYDKNLKIKAKTFVLYAIWEKLT